MDEILHSGLLLEVEQGAAHMAVRSYVFAHPKICAVGYAEAGEARRHIFHRRALQTLQSADASAVELAYHALTAGLAEPAFHWCIAAGDEAMQVFAVRDALTFYEQARHLMAERVHGLPVPEIEHLYIHLGRAYELNAEWEKARTAYTSMLAYAPEAGELVMEPVRLWCGCARLLPAYAQGSRGHRAGANAASRLVDPGCSAKHVGGLPRACHRCRR